VRWVDDPLTLVWSSQHYKLQLPLFLFLFVFFAAHMGMAFADA
jgi:hypothetical protein